MEECSMLNAQVSMNHQLLNAGNDSIHCSMVSLCHSLNVDHCNLNIETTGGGLMC